MVTICTASLTFNNSMFCPHSVFMCFVWIWEQTAIISVCSINWLVFITDIEGVSFAVRTGSLIQAILIFQPVRNSFLHKTSFRLHSYLTSYLYQSGSFAADGQSARNSKTFMDSTNLLPVTQAPANRPYFQPIKSSKHARVLHIFVYFLHYLTINV